MTLLNTTTEADWDEIARRDAENINQLERFLELYKDVPAATVAVRLHRMGVRCMPEMLREQAG